MLLFPVSSICPDNLGHRCQTVSNFVIQLYVFLFLSHQTMVLIFIDGKSEIGVQLRRNICYLVSLRHLIRSRAVTNLILFSPLRPIFLHACATCSELPSDIGTMHQTYAVFLDLDLLRPFIVCCHNINMVESVKVKRRPYTWIIDFIL